MTGAFFALAAAIWLFGPAGAAWATSIALVDLPGTGARPGLEAVVREAVPGADVTTVGPGAFASADGLSGIDVLVFPDSRYFPSDGFPALTAFLSQGGDMALLGGLPFSRPLVMLDGAWVSREELESRKNRTPADFLVDDLGADAAERWVRDGLNKDAGSRARMDGGALRLEIRGYQAAWDWDTFRRDLPTDRRPPADANTLLIEAASPGGSPNLGIELEEDDGTRWFFELPVGREPKRRAVPLDQFQLFSAGPGRDPAGGPQPAHIRRVKLGVAARTARVAPGDHDFLVSEIAFGRSDLPSVPARLQPLAFPLDMAARPYADGTAAGAFSAGAEPQPMPGLRGFSALGVELAGKSRFIPRLEVVDPHRRRLGWAAGEVENFAGAYPGSRWFLAGVEEPGGFYESALFRETFAVWLRRLGDPVEKTPQVVTPPAAAPPADLAGRRLRIEGTRFVNARGEPVFLRGVNYIGPWNRDLKVSTDDYFCAAALEDDFRKAAAFGVNSFRLWFNEDEYIHPHKVATLLRLAETHGICLLVHLRAEGMPDIFPGRTLEPVVENTRTVAAALRGHPMVLGYDLSNEPYVGFVGAMAHRGEPNPMLAFRAYDRFKDKRPPAWREQIAYLLETRPPWPKVPKGIPEDDARQLYALDALWEKEATVEETNHMLDWSTLPGLKRPLDLDGPLPEVRRAVNDGFAFWIRAITDAIRDEDPGALVTVGYHSVLAGLPANAMLDFVNHHTYQRPRAYEDTVKNITTMDRLAAAWPDKPVTLGEFGYTDGDSIGMERLGEGETAIGDLAFYLHAMARGHAGAYKWALNDRTFATLHDVAPWMVGEELHMLYELGFGMFAVDGTRDGRPKPFAHALRFLAAYQASAPPAGTFDTLPAANRIRFGFRYSAPGALFVGDRTFDADDLRWSATAPGILMLWQSPDGLRIMSTADATLVIEKPSVFFPQAPSPPAGRLAGHSLTADRIELGLLAGEDVRFQ